MDQLNNIDKRKPLLVVLPSVPATRHGNDYILDEKAASGLRLYSEFWPGAVRSIFRSGDQSHLLFGKKYAPAELPFEVECLPSNSVVPDELISGATIVLASGDNWLDFPIAAQGARLGVPVCYVIEYILETRLQIILLSDTSLIRKAKSIIWTILAEQKRRHAFALSKGLQSNGTPAAQAYAGLAKDILTFFDTRLSENKMATEEEIAAKRNRIMKGAPLRLAFTGRLEKMKGTGDLIHIATELDRIGKDFTLDIYGAGSLEAEMATTLNAPTLSPSLRSKIRIHRPIDFNRELVPWMRSEVDLFLCCHRQSDPSCTYLETLGCGVPILGYGNRAWSGILNLADVGWATRMGAIDEVVRTIVDLDANRSELVNKLVNAAIFGKQHSFENEFRRRIDQLLWLTQNSKSNAFHATVS